MLSKFIKPKLEEKDLNYFYRLGVAGFLDDSTTGAIFLAQKNSVKFIYIEIEGKNNDPSRYTYIIIPLDNSNLAVIFDRNQFTQEKVTHYKSILNGQGFRCEERNSVEDTNYYGLNYSSPSELSTQIKGVDSAILLQAYCDYVRSKYNL